jgi:heme/copper-type cytochrome/quinol oxidase subunit 2
VPSLPWTEATFWVAAVACAVAQLAIVRSVLIARAPEGVAEPDARLDPARRRPVRRAGEVAWAVVPALALAGVLVFTWRAVRQAASPAPASPAVAVTAEARA